MLTYCLVCNIILIISIQNLIKTKNNRLMLLSQCLVHGNKKSKIMKEQESKRLLSNLGIKTPLNKIPLLNVLF